MALDENIETFVIYVTILTSKMIIYLAQKAQIVLFIAKKITVLAKYLDFANVFLKESLEVLPKRTRISKHFIELKKDK